MEKVMGPARRDPAAERRIDRELDVGEKLLWAGRPHALRAALTELPTYLFSVPWTCFFGWKLWNAWMSPRAPELFRSSDRGPCCSFPFSLINELTNERIFMVPFVLVGLLFLFAPLLAYLHARWTTYAVTDRRVLILSSGLRKSMRTFTATEIGRIECKAGRGGYGDVTFAREAVTDSEGGSGFADVGFSNIAAAQSVARLLQGAFKPREEGP
jgi:hypothetical protein